MTGRRKWERVDDATRAAALEAYRTGEKLADIGRRLGVSDEAVRLWALAAGLPPRRPRTPRAA